jgi:drug/metabolite transporter (DMT)-like permease
MKTNTVALTAAAMVAFAANSVLCRLALGAGLIDAASFATVRTVSGAVILGIALLLRSGKPQVKPDWRSVITLYLYMVFFSFAYLSLSAGTGALVLFGAVQLTMFVVALRSGEHFSPLSWVGLVLAIAGLVYLVSPGITAPDPLGAGLMAVAGVAWGFYSLVGRSAGDPTEATAYNFILAVPLVVVTSLAFLGDFQVSPAGAAYAVASGAIASGIGYVIWYAALRGLTATSAATVQLSVPVIAAVGGVMLMSEDVTVRLVVASVTTLGGVALVLTQRNRKPGTG